MAPIKLRSCSDLSSLPIYCIEHLVQIVGPFFVALVWVLIAGVVWAWYAILRPYLFTQGGLMYTLAHAAVAHWLLVNIVFHYYKGTTTHPGEPPKVSDATYERGVESNFKHCTRCRNLKPERAHHCIICGTCVLKMDHHCPWFNSCVGHFNHRFFYLFMLYIWLGCIYVCGVAYSPFNARKTLRKELRLEHRLGDYHQELVLRGLPEQSSQLAMCFVLTGAVVFALGILIAWHTYLISSAETTIEFYSNAVKRKNAWQAGMAWSNAYFLGVQQNWRVFLGLNNRWSGWRRVLLPSPHLPAGDGLHWTELKNSSQDDPKESKLISI
eukprot:m.127952 g.127952  ORF g.127952 m.127952 type:complete len:325 (-) comp22267_c1_seq1:16-990(-)